MAYAVTCPRRRGCRCSSNRWRMARRGVQYPMIPPSQCQSCIGLVEFGEWPQLNRLMHSKHDTFEAHPVDDLEQPVSTINPRNSRAIPVVGPNDICPYNIAVSLHTIRKSLTIWSLWKGGPPLRPPACVESKTKSNSRKLTSSTSMRCCSNAGLQALGAFCIRQ